MRNMSFYITCDMHKSNDFLHMFAILKTSYKIKNQARWVTTLFRSSNQFFVLGTYICVSPTCILSRQVDSQEPELKVIHN